MACGKKTLAFLHLFTLFISLILLLSQFSLFHIMYSLTWRCHNIPLIPFVIFGILLASLSVFGLMTLFSSKSLLLKIYLCGLFVLALGLCSYSTVSLALTERGIDKATSDEDLDLDIEDFSKHLHGFIIGPSWVKTMTCLEEMELCAFSPDWPESKMRHFVSRVERGCCFPPENCTTESKTNATASNCSLWSNENLCHECNSCKAAVLAELVEPWATMSMLGLVISICLFLIFVAVYAIYRNNNCPKPYSRYAHDGGSTLASFL